MLFDVFQVFFDTINLQMIEKGILHTWKIYTPDFTSQINSVPILPKTTNYV